MNKSHLYLEINGKFLLFEQQKLSNLNKTAITLLTQLFQCKLLPNDVLLKTYSKLKYVVEQSFRYNIQERCYK
ncbi:unnamed protein product [Schistosoma turkestanicum]|nr:unnamed protein product [Schistosoma turkestanicum]